MPISRQPRFIPIFRETGLNGFTRSCTREGKTDESAKVHLRRYARRSSLRRSAATPHSSRLASLAAGAFANPSQLEGDSEMKYVVLLGDGMSDEKLEQLGGRTPLQAAKTPNMDFMAKRGRIGLARTVPAGLPPGSDVANLSIFGYDPRTCYTGRSPLEAASMGIALGEEDVAFRINLVNLEARANTLLMKDYSAGHISTEEGRELVAALQKELGNEEFQFYPGISYRHLL